jgi:hypothetical protein
LLVFVLPIDPGRMRARTSYGAATPQHPLTPTPLAHRPLPRLTATGRPTWPAGCGQTALQGGRSCGLQEQKQGISPPRPSGAASRTCLPACLPRRRRTVLGFWLRRRTACSPFGWLASAASSIRIVSKGNGGKYNCIKTDHAPREEGYYCVHQSYRTRN